MRQWVNSPGRAVVRSGSVKRGNLAGNIYWNCAGGYLDIANCCFCPFQEASMVLRNVFIALVCATALAWSSLLVADEYRPDEFLGLDLSKAVFSPKPLGPATGFTPGPLDVRVESGSDSAQARAEPTVEPKVVVHAVRVARIHTTRLTRQQAERPRMVARTTLARHHRNPLDAQAFDARIQVWPCKSGGICNWKR
jgi:hypothetical protein